MTDIQILAALEAHVAQQFDVANASNLITHVDESTAFRLIGQLGAALQANMIANNSVDALQNTKDAAHDNQITELVGKWLAEKEVSQALQDAFNAYKSAAIAKNTAQDATISTLVQGMNDNHVIDTAQTTKDAAHDAKLAQNEVTDAGQSADIATLKVIRKDATNVFYVDRQFADQAEMLAQDAAALQGVSNRPFATPYSAKKAAILWLALNPTKQAIVEIARGNTFASADYVATEHDVTISMGGVDYVSGAELTFHGIAYVAYGSTITTPLTNAVFIIGQVLNGLAAKKAVFYGGTFTDTGFNSTANANIHFLGTESMAPSLLSRHGNSLIAYDVGIKRLEVAKISGGLLVGDKWSFAPDAGNSRVPETLIYKIGEHKSSYHIPLYVTKLHEKNLVVSFEVTHQHRSLLCLGHFSGVTNDSTPENPLLGGCDNSVLNISVGAVIPTDLIYGGDAGGGYINCPNNRKSTFNVQLCDLGTLPVPKLMWMYGIQESNKYHFKDAKVVLNNPTSVEMPFNLGLGTSVLILDGWDVESNVNSAIFTQSGGTLVLRNCKIRQTANQPVFNIAAGAKVVLENTHFVGKTEISVGAGKIVSKNSTSNVPVGTAVLAGNLTFSENFNEYL